MATRLIDSGKNRNALQYCEMVANEAVRNECCERPLIACVIDLSSKLKMLDPALALTGDVETDPDWLAKLKNFYDNLPVRSILFLSLTMIMKIKKYLKSYILSIRRTMMLD